MGDKINEACSGQKRKRPKKFYIQQAKRQKGNFVLAPGMKGFIVTCNNQEKNCIREAFNLLNEFADKLYAPENENADDSADESVEDALKKEVASLSKSADRRFQLVESKTRNCLFIKTKVEDPCAVMNSILDEVEKTKTQRTKFLIRMLPVLDTCRAYVDDIKKCLENLVSKFFTGAGEKYKTYAFTIKIRNNNSLKKTELLDALVQLMQSIKLSVTADLKNPAVVINIEVLCTICCFSFMKDYYMYRKYNLVEFAMRGKNEVIAPEDVTPQDEVKKIENEAEKKDNVLVQDVVAE